MSREKTYRIDKNIVFREMKKRNLTQTSLGEIIGESRQTIGKFKWTKRVILKVSNFLDLYCFDLLLDKNIETYIDFKEEYTKYIILDFIDKNSMKTVDTLGNTYDVISKDVMKKNIEKSFEDAFQLFDSIEEKMKKIDEEKEEIINNLKTICSPNCDNVI